LKAPAKAAGAFNFHPTVPGPQSIINSKTDDGYRKSTVGRQLSAGMHHTARTAAKSKEKDERKAMTNDRGETVR